MQDEVGEKARALVALLDKHLGTRAGTLEKALRKAGRRLPRRLRDRAQVVVEAEAMAAHPRLMRRIDGAEVSRAFEEVAAHLRAIDRAEARKTRLLRILAGVALNLLIFMVLFIAFLRWRGLV